jgi:hypothetical protein
MDLPRPVPWAMAPLCPAELRTISDPGSCRSAAGESFQHRLGGWARKRSPKPNDPRREALVHWRDPRHVDPANPPTRVT